MKGVGDGIEPAAHLHFGVVAHVVRPIGLRAEQRRDGRAREIVGVHVIGEDVVVRVQRRASPAGSARAAAASRRRSPARAGSTARRRGASPRRAAGLRPRHGGANAASGRGAAASRRRGHRRSRRTPPTSKCRRTAVVCFAPASARRSVSGFARRRGRPTAAGRNASPRTAQCADGRGSRSRSRSPMMGTMPCARSLAPSSTRRVSP